jgi:hypothetical protein
LVNDSKSLHGLLLVETGLVAHLLEDIVEETGEFHGIKRATAVPVVFLEYLLNELLKFLVSDHINCKIYQLKSPDFYLYCSFSHNLNKF